MAEQSTHAGPRFLCPLCRIPVRRRNRWRPPHRARRIVSAADLPLDSTQSIAPRFADVPQGLGRRRPLDERQSRRQAGNRSGAATPARRQRRPASLDRHPYHANIHRASRYCIAIFSCPPAEVGDTTKPSRNQLLSIAPRTHSPVRPRQLQVAGGPRRLPQERILPRRIHAGRVPGDYDSPSTSPKSASHTPSTPRARAPSSRQVQRPVPRRAQHAGRRWNSGRQLNRKP